MEETLKDEHPQTVECETHGEMSAITYSYKDKFLRVVCFACWAEKDSEGLKDYSE